MRPAGLGPLPAVLVLHTSAGLHPEDIQMARNLATVGFVALAVDYYAARGLSLANRQLAFTTLLCQVASDIVAAFRYLQALPGVDPGRVSVVGFSGGGYLAAYLAAEAPQPIRQSLQGLVYYYSGAPRASFRMPSLMAHVDVPGLFLHGELDDLATGGVSFPETEANVATLEGRGIPVTFVLYPGAGHRFDRDQGLVPAAKADALARTRAFLQRPPPVLRLSAPQATGGDTLQVTVLAAPGQAVAVAASLQATGAGMLGGRAIRLGPDLALLGRGAADETGRYTLSVAVPRGLTGVFYLQAASADEAGFRVNPVLSNGAILTLR